MIIIKNELSSYLAVHCPVISGTNGLLMSNSDNKMNTKVVFSCENGMKLNGTDELICLPSGHWSSPIPNCICKWIEYVE